MTIFELYDNINRKTWILQGIVSFTIVIFVWRKKLLNINTENKYYILLVVIILLIKAIMYILCFFIYGSICLRRIASPRSVPAASSGGNEGYRSAKSRLVHNALSWKNGYLRQAICLCGWMLWVPKACWIIISAYANGALAPEYELISRIIKVRTEKKMIQKQRA